MFNKPIHGCGNGLVAISVGLCLFYGSPSNATAIIGDCDSDGYVTAAEIQQVLDVALGNAVLSTCPSGDSNGDGTVTVNELIQAVNVRLNQPPPRPSAAPGLAFATYEGSPAKLRVVMNTGSPTSARVTVLPVNGKLRAFSNDLQGPTDLRGYIRENQKLAWNNDLIYIPNPGFTGTDRFKFQISDAAGQLNVSTIQITVSPRPAPSAGGVPVKFWIMKSATAGAPRGVGNIAIEAAALTNVRSNILGDLNRGFRRTTVAAPLVTFRDVGVTEVVDETRYNNVRRNGTTFTTTNGHLNVIIVNSIATDEAGDIAGFAALDKPLQNAPYLVLAAKHLTTVDLSNQDQFLANSTAAGSEFSLIVHEFGHSVGFQHPARITSELNVTDYRYSRCGGIPYKIYPYRDGLDTELQARHDSAFGDDPGYLAANWNIMRPVMTSTPVNYFQGIVTSQETIYADPFERIIKCWKSVSGM